MTKQTGITRLNLLLLMFGIIIGMVGGIKLMNKAPTTLQGGAVIHHYATPKIEQIKEMSELVTLHVPISDVQTSIVNGYTGSAKVTLVIKGDVDVSTDLSACAFTRVDHPGRKICIGLLNAKAHRPRLDHAQTKIQSIEKTGMWKVAMDYEVEKKLISEAMKNAQDTLLKVANKPELIQQAKDRAEKVLSGFVDSMGYQASFEWYESKQALDAAAKLVHNNSVKQSETENNPIEEVK